MNKQNDELIKLREQLELSRKQYLALADVIAAGSESPEHLIAIARATRQQRDEAIEYFQQTARGLTKRPPDFACRCAQCVSSAYNRDLCEFTRLPMAQSR